MQSGDAEMGEGTRRSMAFGDVKQTPLKQHSMVLCILYMLPGDVKQTTSKCSRRSLSPPELSNFSPLIGFWSDSFDSSSEYGSSRKALKIFTGGRNVSSEIFCVVLPETNGCLTKCRLDLQPPLVRLRPTPTTAIRTKRPNLLILHSPPPPRIHPMQWIRCAALL